MSSLEAVGLDVARDRTIESLGVLPEHVVVLGGTGLLGTAVSRAFLDAGARVTVVARHRADPTRGCQLAGAAFVQGDAADRVVLRRVLDGADHVVVALGVPPPAASANAPADQFSAEIPPLLALLEELGHREGTSLTFLSSGGAIYGDAPALPVHEEAPCRPVSPYGAVKLAAERNIELAATSLDIDARILRVANVYGPLQRPGSGQGIVAALLHAASTGSALHQFGDGRTVRDFLEVDDAARAVVWLAALRSGPRTVNVGTGVGHSLLELHELVEGVTGRRVAIRPEPARDSDVRAVVLDVQRLASLVDWEPVALRDGIERTWSVWQRRIAVDENSVAAGA